MRWPRILYMRCRSLFGRPRLENELSDKLRFHLQVQIQENLAAGMPPDEARRAALADIGGLDQVKEACRDSRGVTLVENAWRDLRYAWRVLARTPAFMAVAILSLALSIGANTAIFSFLNAVLLKALPVSEPHRLVIVARHVDQYGWDTNVFNYPMYREFARRMRSFSGALAYRPVPINLSAGNQAERIQGELVSGSYFRVLGVRPVIGRLFTEDDDGAEGGHAVCVISYRLWQERFGGDPRVLSQPVLLNARPFQIVGVSQPDFEGAALQSRHDMQVPMSMTELFMGEKRDLSGWSWMQILGRLAPGVSHVRAETELQAVGKQLDAAKLAPGIGPGANLWKLTDGSQGVDWQREQLREPVVVLMAAVALLLVIACANMGSLLLARAARRRSEIALRLALGAGRARIVGQLLAESLLLAGIGGVAGWLLSLAMTRLLAAWLAAGSSDVVFRIAPDARVLAFTVAVSLFACLLYGLLPALQASRAELLDALKGSPGGCVPPPLGPPRIGRRAGEPLGGPASRRGPAGAHAAQPADCGPRLSHGSRPDADHQSGHERLQRERRAHVPFRSAPAHRPPSGRRVRNCRHRGRADGRYVRGRRAGARPRAARRRAESFLQPGLAGLLPHFGNAAAPRARFHRSRPQRLFTSSHRQPALRRALLAFGQPFGPAFPLLRRNRYRDRRSSGRRPISECA